LLGKMEQSVDDPEAYATFDLEFHFAIAAATGNRLFGFLLEPFREVLYEGRRMASSIADVPRSGRPFHHAILEKIQARDAAGAAGAMARHLERSNVLILQAFEESFRGPRGRRSRIICARSAVRDAGIGQTPAVNGSDAVAVLSTPPKLND
jgi:DNA-binding FadR family transcriptional regulator